MLIESGPERFTLFQLYLDSGPKLEDGSCQPIRVSPMATSSLTEVEMKIKIYAYWHKYKWEEEFSLGVSCFRITDSFDGVIVQAGDFEVDLVIKPLDHTEEISVQVAALRKEAGEHQAALTQIDARINELLCIEHKEAT